MGRWWPFSFGRILAANSRGGRRPCVMDVRMTEEWTWMSTYTVPASIVGSLDYRVQFDSQLRELKDTPDPYAASRRNYLEGRQAEIDALHGRTSPQPITRRTLPVFP